MNFPGGVFAEVPVIVVIHQGVNHSPGVGVGPPEQQHPQWRDTGEQRTGGVVVGFDPLPGGGEDLTLHGVPGPGLAPSPTDWPAAGGAGDQTRALSQTVQTDGPGPGVERPHHHPLLRHHHTALTQHISHQHFSVSY